MLAKVSRKRPPKPSVIELLSHLDSLPDSAYVRPQVIAMHLDISMSNFYRKVKSKSLPALKDGRVNVGEYRRAISARAVA